MKIADLVQDDWVIDDACLVYLVQLLDCVLFFKIKTKYTVHHFIHGRHTADQKNFFSRNFNGLETAKWTGNTQLH